MVVVHRLVCVVVTEKLFSFPGLAIIMSLNARSPHVVRAFLLLRGSVSMYEYVAHRRRHVPSMPHP